MIQTQIRGRMRHRLKLTLGIGTVCVSGWVAALESSADVRTVVGEWVGTYTCGQGLTGLTLSIGIQH